MVARRVVRLMEFQEVLRSSIPVEEAEELKTWRDFVDGARVLGIDGVVVSRLSVLIACWH